MIKIVTKEDMEILRKYLDGDNSVVLVDEALLEKLPVDTASVIREIDEGDYDLEYTHGGEADVWVDLVTDPKHYFIGCVEDTLLDKKE